MTPEERKPFDDMAEQDRLRCSQELRQYSSQKSTSDTSSPVTEYAVTPLALVEKDSCHLTLSPISLPPSMKFRDGNTPQSPFLRPLDNKQQSLSASNSPRITIPSISTITSHVSSPSPKTEEGDHIHSKATSTKSAISHLLN
jgi:hypothetical protein